jgi:hypothetical protein
MLMQYGRNYIDLALIGCGFLFIVNFVGSFLYQG